MVPTFSIVVPVFNEEACLGELYARLTAVLGEMGEPYELVLVDDGSTDDSWPILAGLHARDPRVRVIRLSRNFGQHIALTAGIDAAVGEVVALMDADLQDRPEELPGLYARLEEGFDVVYAIRRDKQHSLFKRVTSRIFGALMNRIGGGHRVETAVFRMARRPVIEAVKCCREQARFVLGLFSWVGFRQTGVEVTHGARHGGHTKYSLLQMTRLAFDSVTAFSRVPLRLATYLGLLVSACSFGFGAWLVFKKLAYDTAVHGWTSTMVVMLFLGGAQLLCIGVVGEYIGRIYGESQGRPLYIVATELSIADGRRAHAEPGRAPRPD